MCPNFDVRYQLKPNHYNNFMAVFIDLWPYLFTAKLSYPQLFKWGHSIKHLNDDISFLKVLKSNKRLLSTSVHCPDYTLCTRGLLRFEYQLPHPILCATLATHKNWHFHISYQSLEISVYKVVSKNFNNQKCAPKMIYIKRYFFCKSQILFLT